MIAQGTTATTLEAQVINTFNSKLAAKISSFKSSHSGVTTYLYDSYTTFNRLLDSPKTYGFRDATTYGTGADIFWNNDYHPGYTAHNYIAQDLAKVLAGSGF
ncbi:hypothetical protein AAF712_011925 [Marasmius tenuissimus]|uniref:Uncharacterized protein n=1 Tax=Marasmius tenuissimus TaxID=585030 RepID=A0ABR2ZJ81_9AGAR|nr:hypothetical protein PM082_015277 [Marasmius tenuissimus]